MQARGITPPLHMRKNVLGDLIECREQDATYLFKGVFHGMGNNYLICHYQNQLTKKWDKAKFQGKLWNKAKAKITTILKITDWPIMSDNTIL